MSKQFGTISVVDFTETFEGEFPFAGYYITMIRFPHCNLSCLWCDTDFSVAKLTITIDDIISSVGRTKNLMLTGGEPGLHSGSIYDISSKILSDPSCYIDKIYVQTNGLIFRSSLDKKLETEYEFKDFYYVWSPKFYDEKVTQQTFTYLVTLPQYINLSSLYLKIVVDENVIDKIKQFLENLVNLYGVNLMSRVSLMPLTSETNNLGNTQIVQELCREYSVHFSPRIHMIYNFK